MKNCRKVLFIVIAIAAVLDIVIYVSGINDGVMDAFKAQCGNNNHIDRRAFRIPQKASVTMKIDRLHYGNIPVSRLLLEKIKKKLKSINSECVLRLNLDSKNGRMENNYAQNIKITITYGKNNSYIYFDKDFACVTSGNGTWYKLKEYKENFLIDRVFVNGKYFYDIHSNGKSNKFFNSKPKV